MNLRHLALVGMVGFILSLSVAKHGTAAEKVLVAQAGQKYAVTVYSAPFGTAAYVLGQAWEIEVQKGNYPLEIFTIEGKGSIGNLRDFDRILALRKKAIHVTGDDSMVMLERGLGPFARKPLKNSPKKMLKIGAMWNSGGMMVTFDKSIKSVRELKGKSIAVGGAGQGFGVIPKLILEEGYGLKGKANIQMIGHKAAIQALLDNKVDAAFFSLHPSRDGSVVSSNPGSLPLATSGRDVNILSWDKEVIQRFIKQGFPFYLVELRPGQLQGMVKKRRLIFGNSISWWSYPGFSEETAYWLTKTLIDNSKNFPKYHRMGVLATPDNICGDKPGRYNPGSRKACREAGFFK